MSRRRGARATTMLSRDALPNGDGVSRRTFLTSGGAALAGAVTVAGCSGGSTAATPPTTTTPTTAEATTSSSVVALNGDTAIAASAASLEVLAVDIYKAGLAAAAANRLGAVPPAITTFATTVMAHHQAALDKWNSIVTSGGAQAVNQPPDTLKATFDRLSSRVTDAIALARLALQLEQTASDTYLSVVSTLQSKTMITLAGQLQVIDQEHAAILRYLVGSYPIPDVFQNTNMAFSG